MPIIIAIPAQWLNANLMGKHLSSGRGVAGFCSTENSFEIEQA